MDLTFECVSSMGPIQYSITEWKDFSLPNHVVGNPLPGSWVGYLTRHLAMQAPAACHACHLSFVFKSVFPLFFIFDFYVFLGPYIKDEE